MSIISIIIHTLQLIWTIDMNLDLLNRQWCLIMAIILKMPLYQETCRNSLINRYKQKSNSTLVYFYVF